MPTLAVVRQRLHVSASALRSYLRCPRQFQHHYVLGTEPDGDKVPLALVFGSSVHHALASYYLHLKDRRTPPSLGQTIASFKEVLAVSLDDSVDLEGGTPDDVIGLGERLLTAFHAQAGAPKVLAVEHAFTVPVMDPTTGEILEEQLVGSFDAVVEDERGRPVVLEHKTAARRWSDDQLQHDLQGSLYALAMNELGSSGPVTVRYQILTKTKAATVQIENVEKTARDVDDARHVVAGVLRAIDAGVFYPVRGWQCDNCAYSQSCSDAGGRSAQSAASMPAR